MKWLLKLYPPAWRRRYGEEFLVLLEAQSFSLIALIDIALGAFDAHLHFRASAKRTSRPLWLALLAGGALALLLFSAAAEPEAVPLVIAILVTIAYVLVGIWGLRTLGEIKRYLADERCG